MFDRVLVTRLVREIKNLFPLFRYLILQTETHAFCLALAAAALIGFFPSCLVMLTVFKYISPSKPYWVLEHHEDFLAMGATAVFNPPQLEADLLAGLVGPPDYVKAMQDAAEA